jgi:hypothetical protein
MFYSATTKGFYDENIHDVLTIIVDGDVAGNPECKIPQDAIQIPDEEYNQLLLAQSEGKVIEPNEDGYPVVVDPPLPTQEEILALQIAELEAQITNVRLADFMLGIDNGWLAAQRAQIEALRAQL